MPSIISFISQGPVTTTNSFSTIQPDFGTSPVASSATDTLTLTSSDGSVTITGNSATDTINFQATTTPLTAQYVVLATDATLPNERILTGTPNQVIITDNGAGNSVVLSLPQNINTTATPTFTGIHYGNVNNTIDFVGRVIAFDIPDQWQTVDYLANGEINFISYYNSSTFINANRLARIDMTYDVSLNPILEVWSIYDTDGTTVLRTYTYTHSFTGVDYTQTELAVT